MLASILAQHRVQYSAQGESLESVATVVVHVAHVMRRSRFKGRFVRLYAMMFTLTHTATDGYGCRNRLLRKAG